MNDPDIPESGAVFTFGKSKFAENAPQNGGTSMYTIKQGDPPPPGL